MNQKLLLFVYSPVILTSAIFGSEPSKPIVTSANHAIQIIDHIDNNHFDTALALLKTPSALSLDALEKKIIFRQIEQKEHALHHAFPRFMLGAFTTISSLNALVVNYTRSLESDIREVCDPVCFYTPFITLTSGSALLLQAYKDMWNVNSEDEPKLTELKKLVTGHTA
ncbi:MAG: hypothetical protein WCE21_02145 [Candidatus Babeliales bacterium]